jgi:hypothetical protein
MLLLPVVVSVKPDPEPLRKQNSDENTSPARPGIGERAKDLLKRA